MSDSPRLPKASTVVLWTAACGFMALAVFSLWAEHSAHMLGALPYLLLLLCPLMHVFMHRGNGHHSRTPPRRGSGAKEQGGHGGT